MASGALSDFEDRKLAEVAAELCVCEGEQSQALVAERLTAVQHSALSAQMFDPMLENAEKARFVLGEYQRTLVLLRQEKQMREQLRMLREVGGIEVQQQKA